jgi:hypothetical protein
MVLSLLAALVLLTVAILGSASTERRMAGQGTGVAQAGGLVDVAAGLVVSQLREATGDARSFWASQPGAVRSWMVEGGAHRGSYKLYSSREMVVDEEAALVADRAPEAWAEMGDRYADLNAPLWRDGELRFPALDPAAAVAGAGGLAAVAGFGVEEGVVGARVSGGLDRRLPMPVEWIYQLRDGSLGHLDEGGRFVAAGGGEGATRDNPIVGRVAFWADDETSKVNVNTASEPTFWDLPRGVCREDIGYGTYQPVQNEFQRYPGHPATTALGPILFGETDYRSLTAAQAADRKESIYLFVPRVGGGGSRAATVRVGANTGLYIIPDNDRLYAGVGEMVFSPDRMANPSAAALMRITPERVARGGFFLTAAGRSPELTLRGHPRVAIWPVAAEEMRDDPRWSARYHRTAKDSLFAHAANLGGAPYVFQRMNADSVDDFFSKVPRNVELYDYLLEQTRQVAPGQAASFASKWRDGSGDDHEQVILQMVDYIRQTNLYDDTHPQDVYAGGEEHLVTQFTNSQSNTTGGLAVGHGQVAPLRRGDAQGIGRYFSLTEVGVLFLCTADGDEGQDGGRRVPKGDGREPTEIGTLMNYGPHPDLQDTDPLNDHWYSNIPPNPTASNYSAATWLGQPLPSGVLHPAFGRQENWNRTLEPGRPLQAGQRRVQCVFYLEPNCLGKGHTWIREDMVIRVRGLGQFQLDGQPLGLPDNASQVLQSRLGSGWHMHPFGGSAGLRTWLTNSPYVGGYVTLDGDGPMQFSGGRIEIDILLHDSVMRSRGEPAVLVQTMEVRFPNGTFPKPELVETGTFAYRGAGRTEAPYWWSFGQPALQGARTYGDGGNPTGAWSTNLHRRSWIANQAPNAPFHAEVPPEHRFSRSHGNHPPGFKTGSVFRAEDVARSMVPRLTDFRLHVARRQVGEDMWVPHEGWNDTSQRFNHLAQEMFGLRYHGYSNPSPVRAQDIVPDNQLTLAHYHQSSMPDVPIGGGRHQRTGDYDNGIGPFRDGSYYNRADEGQLAAQESYFASIWTFASPQRTYFSPNRMVPSPAMFGSLPTGVKRGRPYETLLFRPWVRTQRAVEQGYDHPGAASPPDHLVLDHFWMPVIEPYAISERFSSAGKVNLNTQIVPFGHIRRETAMHSLLASEELLAIPNAGAMFYKQWDHSNSDWSWFPHERPPNSPWFIPVSGWNRNVSYRRPVDVGQTLRQWEEIFSGERTGTPTLFRSATELCEQHLVPVGTTLEQMRQEGAAGYWGRHEATGENARERHYANLYGRVTTRSNSFRVHVRAQALSKARGSDPGVFSAENGDGVEAEVRGSVLVERYLDPGDGELPDMAVERDQLGTVSLEELHRYRVLERERFGG